MRLTEGVEAMSEAFLNYCVGYEAGEGHYEGLLGSQRLVDIVIGREMEAGI